jgi:hypothetical protein
MSVSSNTGGGFECLPGIKGWTRRFTPTAPGVYQVRYFLLNPLTESEDHDYSAFMNFVCTINLIYANFLNIFEEIRESFGSDPKLQKTLPDPFLWR